VTSLDPLLRELLELLVIHDDLSGPALDQLQPSDLELGQARSIYETIARLHQHALPTTFDRVMLEIESPGLKSLLVQLHDTASKKEQFVQEEPMERLLGVFRRLDDPRLQLVQRQRMAALDRRELSDQEELRLLEQLIAEQRSRQGISAPTDG
jgi:hypothetical protein